MLCTVLFRKETNERSERVSFLTSRQLVRKYRTRTLSIIYMTKVLRVNFSLQALDKSGAGTCSLPEFRQMMRKFKIDLNEEEFFHLFSFYDKNMTGKISYNDFLRVHLEWKWFDLGTWRNISRRIALQCPTDLRFFFVLTRTQFHAVVVEHCTYLSV